MSAAESARARLLFCVYAALDALASLIMAGLLLLALSPLAADVLRNASPVFGGLASAQLVPGRNDGDGLTERRE